jgi:multidrug resistance efflux pump
MLPNRLSLLSVVTCFSLWQLTGSAFSQDIQRIEAQEAQMQLLRQIPISAEVAGTLVSVFPTEEGVFVKKGDVLIQLNDAVIKAEVARAKTQAEQTTEIEFAKKSLEIAETNLAEKRDANLKRPGVLIFTPNEMRLASLEVEKAEAQHKKAVDDHILHGLDTKVKEAQLAQYTVVAPLDGLVTKVQRFPGQNVRPGDPVLTLVDTSELRAVKVQFRYRDLLFVGDEVEIRVDESRRTLARPPADQNSPATPGNIFDRVDDKVSVQPAPVQHIVAEETEVSPENGKFIGQIRFIEPSIETDSTGAYLVKVSVGVPNRQDKFGRFQLLEGMPVKAVILARKRPK